MSFTIFLPASRLSSPTQHQNGNEDLQLLRSLIDRVFSEGRSGELDLVDQFLKNVRDAAYNHNPEAYLGSSHIELDFVHEENEQPYKLGLTYFRPEQKFTDAQTPSCPDGIISICIHKGPGEKACFTLREVEFLQSYSFRTVIQLPDGGEIESRHPVTFNPVSEIDYNKNRTGSYGVSFYLDLRNREITPFNCNRAIGSKKEITLNFNCSKYPHKKSPSTSSYGS